MPRQRRFHILIPTLGGVLTACGLGVEPDPNAKYARLSDGAPAGENLDMTSRWDVELIDAADPNRYVPAEDVCSRCKAAMARGVR